jgi:hypothetical protein
MRIVGGVPERSPCRLVRSAGDSRARVQAGCAQSRRTDGTYTGEGQHGAVGGADGLVRHGASKREFDCFAAQEWDPLLRTGYLMTGDAKDAEDLVQETLLKARRWIRVRAMDHPAAYARWILIDLVLHDAGRRSRQRAELWPQGGLPNFEHRHSSFLNPQRVFRIEGFLGASERRRHEMTVCRVGDINIFYALVTRPHP